MIDNNGKVAVVFGVRNDLSIAFAVAKKLKNSGAIVILSYLKEHEVELKKLISENQFDVICSSSNDVTSEAELELFFNKIQKEYKGIDYLFHSVAFASPKIISMSKLASKSNEEFDYLHMPFDQLMQSFDISAYSLIRIVRASLEILNKNASIVTLTFVASSKVIANYGGMGMIKAALENITLYLAEYLGPRNIRINAISSGLIMTSSAGGIRSVRKMREQNNLNSPLGQIDSDDVAGTALFYFSDLSKRNTGNIHYVDGGGNIIGARGSFC